MCVVISEKDYHTAKGLMLLLPCHQVLSKNLAIQSANHYRQLKKQGITIRKTIDMLIATWCVHNHIPLLENDIDYVQIADVFPLKIVREEK